LSPHRDLDLDSDRDLDFDGDDDDDLLNETWVLSMVETPTPSPLSPPSCLLPRVIIVP
jgi:hypothetical protein